MKYLVLFVTILSYVEAGIPSYFDKCCVNNATNACLSKNLNMGWQLSIAGDKHANIPNFDPARLPAMTLYKGITHSFRLGTVRISGLSGAVHSDVQIDFTHKTVKVKINIPQILILSTYEFDGVLGLYPTIYHSFGGSRIEMDNVNIERSFQFDTDPNEYVFVKNAVLQYTVDQITYQLNNAAPLLSQLLNSQAFNGLYKPFIAEAFSDIFTWRFRSIGEVTKITELYDFDC